MSEKKLIKDLALIGVHELKVSIVSFYSNNKKSPTPNNEYNKYGSTVKI